MIRLKNVSIEVLNADSIVPELQKTIEERNIISIEDLLNEIGRSPEINWLPIKDRLEDTLEQIKKSNLKNKEAKIYLPREYQDKSLEYTDSKNKGNVLMIWNPTARREVKPYRLSLMSVQEIKRELSHTYASGENYFVHSRKNGLGEKYIPKVLNALDYYTEQVERQATLTPRRDINLFTYQQGEKREIVERKYAEIIAYLIYDSKEFLWGDLSEAKKKRFISSIINHQFQDENTREIMIQMISDYTTLEELERLLKGDYKVLKRFIKR